MAFFRILEFLSPFIYAYIIFATREYSVVDWRLVPAKDAGVNPCRIGNWGPPSEEIILQYKMYDWCVGTEIERMVSLMGFMRRHTNPRTAFSTAVEFGSNVNIIYWQQDGKRFLINLKITGHSDEMIKCGDKVNGVEFMYDRYAWVDVHYYDGYFDEVTERVTDYKRACMIQFMVAHYLS